MTIQLLEGSEQLVQGVEVSSGGLRFAQFECLRNATLLVDAVRVEEEDVRFPSLSRQLSASVGPGCN